MQLIDAFVSPLINEPSQQAEPAHVRLSIATNFDVPSRVGIGRVSLGHIISSTAP